MVKTTNDGVPVDHESLADSIDDLRTVKDLGQIDVSPPDDSEGLDIWKRITKGFQTEEESEFCYLCGLLIRRGNTRHKFPGAKALVAKHNICALCNENPFRKGHSKEYLEEIARRINKKVKERANTQRILIEKGIRRMNKQLRGAQHKKRRKHVGKIDREFILKKLRKIEKSGHTINLEELARSAYGKNGVFWRVRNPEDFLCDIAQQMYLIIHDAPYGQTPSYYRERADKRVRRFISSGCFNPSNSSFATYNKTWKATQIRGNPEHLESSYFEASESIIDIRSGVRDEESIFKQRSLDLASHEAGCLRSMWSQENIVKQRTSDRGSYRPVCLQPLWFQIASVRHRNFGHYLNPLNNPVICTKLAPFFMLHNIGFSNRQFRLARDLFSADSFEVMACRYFPEFYDPKIFDSTSRRYLPDEYVQKLNNNSYLPVNVHDICEVRAAQRRAQSAVDLESFMHLRTIEERLFKILKRQSDKLDDLIISISNIFEKHGRRGILDRLSIRIDKPYARKYISYLQSWTYLAYLFNKTSWSGSQFNTAFVAPICEKNSKEIQDPKDQIISVTFESGCRIVRSRSYYILAGDWRMPYDGTAYIEEEWGLDLPADKKGKIQIPFYDIVKELEDRHKKIACGIFIGSEWLSHHMTSLTRVIRQLHYIDLQDVIDFQFIQHSDISWNLAEKSISKWKRNCNSIHISKVQKKNFFSGRNSEYKEMVLIIDDTSHIIEGPFTDPDPVLLQRKIDYLDKKIIVVKDILKRKNIYVSTPSLWPIATENGFRYINDEGQIVECKNERN